MTENSNIQIFKNTKFQTARLGCFFRLPLTQKNLSYATLLALYQGNVSDKYRTMQEQATQLAELYDVNLSIFPQVRGNQIIFQFQLEWVETDLIVDPDYTLQKIVEFAKEILLHPLFDDVSATMLKLTKNELFDEVDEFFDSPDNVAFYDFYKHYYADRPEYSATLFGDVELLHSVTLPELAEFQKNLLAVPTLIIGTAAAEAELTSLVEQQIVLGIAGITRRFAEPKLIIAANEQPYQEVKREFGSQQSQLFMGYAFTNQPRNRWISNVFTQYLGGDESSVLFQNVREKLGAAYAVDALNYNDNNLLVVAAGLQKDKLQVSRAAIEAEIAQIAQGDLKEAVLEQAKKSLLRQRKMMFDRQKNILAVTLNERLRGRKLTRAETELEVERNVAAVSAADMAQFAQQLILKESYVLD